jgi:hypothetical protein
MNNTWEKALENGQESIGFVDVYTSNVEGKKVKAIINYLPQFQDNNNNKQVHITLFFEGSKSDITDGLFHWIYDDICELIQENIDLRFTRKSEPLDFVYTQTFIVKNIPEFEHYTHGDYGLSANRSK